MYDGAVAERASNPEGNALLQLEPAVTRPIWADFVVDDGEEAVLAKGW
jgi:hypothetical protein